MLTKLSLEEWFWRLYRLLYLLYIYLLILYSVCIVFNHRAFTQKAGQYPNYHIKRRCTLD